MLIHEKYKRQNMELAKYFTVLIIYTYNLPLQQGETSQVQTVKTLQMHWKDTVKRLQTNAQSKNQKLGTYRAYLLWVSHLGKHLSHQCQ